MLVAQKKWLIYIVCGVILFGLGLFAYLGIFNRYYADDWCYNKDFNRLGVVGALQGYTYIRTYASNRYALTLLSGLIYKLGIPGVQIMTPFTILTWLVGVYWTLHNLKRNNHWEFPAPVVFITAGIMVYSSITLAPHLYQNLYWRSGLLPYTAPLAIIPYISGAITQQARAPKNGILLVFMSAATAFLAGGFSEAASAYLVSGLVIYFTAVCIGLLKKKAWARRTFWITLITLCFALLALTLEIVSPANEARQLHSYGTSTSLSALPRLVLVYTYFYIRVTTNAHALSFIAIFALPLALGTLYDSSTAYRLKGYLIIRWVIGIGLVTFLLVGASLTPSLYIEGGLPAPRAQIIPLFTLICATVSVAWVAGIFLRNKLRARWFAPTAILLLCLALIYSTQTILATARKVDIYADRAATWDQRDQYIREAAHQGADQIDVYGIDSAPVGGLYDLKPDSKHWVNRCAALYYGVKEIRASQDDE